MRHRPTLAVLTTALLLLAGPPAADAALAPGTVKKLKDRAPDVFNVEVRQVKETGKKGSVVTIVYTVKVTAVTRTGQDVKQGQTIHIESYDDQSPIPEPGPANPSRLKPGWKGKVYTKYDAKTKRFRIAVFGHSFESGS